MPRVCDSGPSSGQARGMNEPDDRPTPSDRPAPYNDPPPRLETYPVADQPLGDEPLAEHPMGRQPLGDEPSEDPASAAPAQPATEPEARWEDVVDPEPVVVPAPPAAPAPVADAWPAPARPTQAPMAARPSSDDRGAGIADDDLEDDYDDYDPRTSRWVSLLATIGTALIGIVTVQVLASIVEGVTLKSG